jgi:hypothetical protein
MEDRSRWVQIQRLRFLARIARRKELIETSKKIIGDSKTLVEQSHRLIRNATGHDVDGEGNNHKRPARASISVQFLLDSVTTVKIRACSILPTDSGQATSVIDVF